jgi:hypothetical protein
MAHKVKIKDFSVDMEIKNKGIELQVHIDDEHQGDLVITKTGPEWCPGRTKAGNGLKISWKEFIEWAENKEK